MGERGKRVLAEVAGLVVLREGVLFELLGGNSMEHLLKIGSSQLLKGCQKGGRLNVTDIMIDLLKSTK